MADEKKTPQLKKRAMGRGLDALLSDNRTVLTEEGVSKELEELRHLATQFSLIPVDKIEVNPFQPRTNFDIEALKELSESIKVQGIIQPITVRQLDEDTYQLISGERRLKASKMAGLTEIPAYIRTGNDQQMLEMALIENIQREELNPVEVALSYQRLIAECNLKQEELGDRVGKKRTTVNNYLRLLKLPPDIQAGLRDGKVSMGHARALINIDSVDIQLSIYKRIIEEDLSVRKVEDLVRELADREEKKPNSQKKPADYALLQLQSKLSSRFGTKVQIKKGADNKGEIKIPFVSEEDLNRILEMLA
ncbi:ParB/RepB/Spo0J family partition protein [Thermoflexibacter ruber]|uniref:Chromosome partitioning protein, ParB family n=1 Tax=Thermoflexibacter ruber TaxID=1003 RepID=A0A1I2CHF9_9BACT|nr:ParB/RepB/Spo0J family partition protein [Thermoflexibacter ruber]SFE67746.1 chromosome partitioning protein, ParB family [Thermoflexibacter ruber]